MSVESWGENSKKRTARFWNFYEFLALKIWSFGKYSTKFIQTIFKTYNRDTFHLTVAQQIVFTIAAKPCSGIIYKYRGRQRKAE